MIVALPGHFTFFIFFISYLSDGFYRADRLSRGPHRLLSRPPRQLFGLCRRDGSYLQGENRMAKSVVLKAIQA